MREPEQRVAPRRSDDEPMLRRTVLALSQQSRARAAAGGVLLAALAGLVDYVSGPEFGPLLFYLVPVALVAWSGRRPDAVLVAVLVAGLWLIMEATRGRTYSSSWMLGWNAFTRLTVFLVAAGAVTALRARYILERHLAREAGGDPKVPCPYCGSQDTLRLVRSLVCRTCQRSASLSDLPKPAS